MSKIVPVTDQFDLNSFKKMLAKTTTILQPKDAISTIICDIYHLLSAEKYNSCEKIRLFECLKKPLLYQLSYTSTKGREISKKQPANQGKY
ncbi:MAG: hypothetical protein DRP56_05375 [Planctomycetota bacterium]|nr:MAG: hypothetical protein DRP56_05375 [Planctomycetota bacterium]RKY11563.1 MAG: hypothetical protein DRP52_05760 [Planctomycetota bacterium]